MPFHCGRLRRLLNERYRSIRHRKYPSSRLIPESMLLSHQTVQVPQIHCEIRPLCRLLLKAMDPSYLAQTPY